MVRKMQEAAILDQMENIRVVDSGNMLKRLMETPQYCEDALQLAQKIEIPQKVNISEKISIKYKKPRHIIMTGMGGSAIGGEILQDWLREDFPISIEVCRDYDLPAYADEDTLIVSVSYSGDTEETLSTLLDAVNRRCMIVTITSGGHMLHFAEKLGLPCVTIMNGLPPRVAIPYLFFPLPIILVKMGLLTNRDEEIREAIRVLRKLSEENSPETSVKNNFSKRLALDLAETIPVVYGFRHYGAIAHRIKTQFNENTKIPSKYEVFPELNHNEVMGWEATEDITRKFSIILLRDSDEPPEIRHRIETTKRLALSRTHKVLEIPAKGEKKLAKMLSTMYIGDLVSFYLAILRKTDPTPVKTISEIKSELSKKLDTVKALEQEFKRLSET